MNQLICIRHSNLDARVSPELSCKTCCTIFVNGVRERRQETEDQATQWVKEQKRVNTGSRVNPLGIK